MNKVSEFKYSKFLNWNEYIDSMSENKENFKKLTNKILKDKDLINKINKLNTKLNNKEIIVLTEDFCPDSLFNIPILIQVIARRVIMVVILLHRQMLQVVVLQMFSMEI